MDNGDTLELHLRTTEFWYPCKVCEAVLVQAMFHSGSATRTVSDPFRLAFAACWHNVPRHSLVVLLQPRPIRSPRAPARAGR